MCNIATSLDLMTTKILYSYLCLEAPVLLHSYIDFFCQAFSDHYFWSVLRSPVPLSFDRVSLAFTHRMEFFERALGHHLGVCQIVMLMIIGVYTQAQSTSTSSAAAESTAADGNGTVPTCYFPDGTKAVGDYACRLDTTTSSCCTIGAQCLDSGLCKSNGDESIIRTSCTDKSWKSVGCAEFCLGTWQSLLFSTRAHSY